MKIIKVSSSSPQQQLDLNLFNYPTMELPTSLTKEKIKFLKYGRYHVIFVTTNNNVYIYESKVNEIIKVDDIHFGNIKFLECGNKYAIIVNEFNNFYFYGDFPLVNNNKKFMLIQDLNFNFNKIKELRTGYQHLFILTDDNSIYGFGKNTLGQLGLNNENKYFYGEFKKINDLKVKDIQCGYQHSVLLDFNGNIYTTGNNSYNALGFDNTKTLFNFTKVELPFKVIKIFADMFSTFILSTNNDLYGIGYNNDGQLGLGDTEQRREFTKINLQFYYDENLQVLKSFNEFSFIKNKNDIYFSGISENIYLFDLKETTKFTKLNIKNNNYNIYPILNYSDIYLVLIDYKINGEEEDKDLLKLLERLQNLQLIDVDFLF